LVRKHEHFINKIKIPESGAKLGNKKHGTASSVLESLKQTPISSINESLSSNLKLY
jgi:hypothetical protein